MASEGPNSPGTVQSVSVGEVAWTNPSNATSSNNSHATVSLDQQPSDYLTASNFGFSIPVGATIDGIVVEFEKRSDQGGNIVDDVVQLAKAGVWIGTNKGDAVTQWPASDAYASYGAINDLWGTTWTVSDINNSGFGARIQATETGVGVDTAYIDHVRITVYYTEAGGGGGSQRRMTLLGVG